MAADPFKGPNAEFRNKAANINTKVLATPLVYGVSVPQSVSLNADFLAFDAAYQATIDPETRTPGKVQLMHDTMAMLKNNLRMIARIIQANPAVTNEQRVDLGLPVRETPSPWGVPGFAPVLEIIEMNGWQTKARAKQPGSESRGMPDQCAGINIFSYVGATPPSDPKAWVFEGDSSKAIFEVAFDAELPVGTRVWICASYKNARFQAGPACSPLGLVIGGGIPETSVG